MIRPEVILLVALFSALCFASWTCLRAARWFIERRDSRLLSTPNDEASIKPASQPSTPNDE